MLDSENYGTRLGKSMTGQKGPHFKVSEDTRRLRLTILSPEATEKKQSVPGAGQCKKDHLVSLLDKHHGK